MLQVGDSMLQLDLIDVNICTFVIHLLLEAHEIMINDPEGLVEGGDGVGQLSVLGLQLVDMLRLIL
jgi:hypothetical protein